jgi:hypothetical protein
MNAEESKFSVHKNGVPVADDEDDFALIMWCLGELIGNVVAMHYSNDRVLWARTGSITLKLESNFNFRVVEQ